VRIDSGGLGKGLFADLVAERLIDHAAFAVECGGDLRLGGGPRLVEVTSPFDGTIIHAFELAERGVATSGIGKRSWLDPSGAPAHHLLDPGTGRPAFTGIVQVTALAPTALEAEMLTKAALLSGPGKAREWLPHGGVLVYDDGSHEALEPERRGERNGHQRRTAPVLDHE
jgi:thiamine biosynthesis lipoprotein